jgi:hypothetical protein
MKCLAVLLLFVSFTFAQSIQERVDKFQDGKKFEVRYDKFKKQTLVQFDITLQASNGVKKFNSFLDFTAILWLSDDGSNDRVGFMFTREGWYKYPTLRVLVDEDLIRFEDDDLDRFASFTLTPAQLQHIANAKTVELQIENFETTLDDKTMLKLRNLASLIKR